MFLFAVESTHQLVEMWPRSLLQSVLWLLRFHEFRFTAVEVFHRGPSYAKSRPTIVVTTHNVDQKSNEKVKRSIKSYCLAKGASLEVVLEQGKIFGAKTEITRTGGIVGRVFTKAVNLGQSIGVEAKGEGTFGGYVKLRDPTTAKATVYGMTNYHVVRGSDPHWPVCEFNESL